MFDKYGSHFLDEVIDYEMGLESYHGADWIAETHNDSAEDDVDALVAKIGWLRLTG